MHSFRVALLAVAATVVAAQDLSSIPQCALGPAIAALSSTGCAATDFKCICSNSAFITNLTPAVTSACSASDLQKAIAAAQGLCASVGVTLNIPGSAPTTSSAAPPAPPATSSAPAAPAPTTSSTTSAAASVAPSSAAPSGSSAPSSSSAAAPAVPATTSSKASAPVAGVSTVYVTVCSSSTSSVSVPAPVIVTSTSTSKPSNVTTTKTASPSVFTGAAGATYASASVFGGVAAFAVALLL